MLVIVVGDESEIAIKCEGTVVVKAPPLVVVIADWGGLVYGANEW